MKINKVDDKPMVIHTKKNSELHTCKGKHTDIRKTEARDFRDINTPNRKSVITRPKSKGNTINQNRGIMAKVQERAERMKSHISTSKTGKGIGVSVKFLHAAGAETALGQVEGGEKIRDAAHVAQTIYRPVTGIASKGAELAKQQAVQSVKKRIKKVNAGKRLAKSSAKEAVKQTAKIAAKESAKFDAEVAAETGAAAPLVGMVEGKAVGEKVAYELDKADVKMTARTRKIRFFVDKMKDKEDQPDWVHLGVTEDGIPVNSYFATHPEMILGHMEDDKGKFGEDSRYTSFDKNEKQRFTSKLHHLMQKSV